VIIPDCTFTVAQAGTSGGAVYASGSTITISGYTSNGTVSGNRGGSLHIGLGAGNTATVTDAVIANSAALNSASDNFVYGGGGIYVDEGTAALTGVVFTDVKVQGSGQTTRGGAVAFSKAYLTMTGCTITNAASDKAGGAIGGFGLSSCIFDGVSFTNCTAPQGSLLYGNRYSDDSFGDAPAYTVRPGCSVDGTVITGANWSSVLSGNSLCLVNGSTITWSP
jgi:hypothetical protein